MVLRKLIKKIKLSQRDRAITKYREFEYYEPDIKMHEAKSLFIDRELPSEPPSGVTYHFCASGYFAKDRNLDYCVIYTEWRNVNNYCHWTFSELPLIYLALESISKNIVIPDNLLNAKEPYQIRWWKILYNEFAHKKIIPLSKLSRHVNGIVPVNHDTSSSNKMIGKCEYKHYHHGRPTPYCIDLYSKLRSRFSINENLNVPYFYINRRNRRLKNETEV